MGRPVKTSGARLALDALPPRLTANGASSGQLLINCENRSRVPLMLSVSDLASSDLQVAFSALTYATAPTIYLSSCGPSGQPSTRIETVGQWSPIAPGFCTINAQISVKIASAGGLPDVVKPVEDVTVT